MIIFQNTYDICKKKIDKHMSVYPKDNVYQYSACSDGNYKINTTPSLLKNKFAWTASFITGLAPLIYNTEKDERYIKWAEQYSMFYADKIFNHPLNTMHDLGFLYSAYSVAMYNHTGSKLHRDTALKAADELLKRFDINGRYIDAWNDMDNDQRTGRAIVDCMLNIQLLFWAWKETGHTIYRDIAEAHADTTIKYFIRDDFSICHSFDFDRKTGKILNEHNDCGYSNGSYWARGTAWMIYGLSITARYLEDEYYYEVAVKVLNKYLESMNGKFVPVWDFKLPKDKPALKCGKEPAAWDESNPENCKYNIDTSAATIVVCAMQEMNKFKSNKKYQELIEETLVELCEKYFNSNPNVCGILSNQNGQMQYTTYGDYYFVQALQVQLYDCKTCW